MPSCAHRRADGLKGQTVNFFVYLCTNIKNKGMYIGLSCMCPDLRNRYCCVGVHQVFCQSARLNMHPSNNPSSSGLFRKPGGFTAIEMMVVIAILGILAVIAAPSFLLMIESMRTNNAMDEVQGALMYARSEAVRNRNNVVVRGKPLSGCRPDEGDSNENWSCGWVMFVDTNANNARDASEATLKETGELNGVTLIHRGGVSHAFLVFNSMGYINNTPGNFTARPRGNTDDERSSIRTLCIDRTARIRRIKGTGC